MEYDFNFRSRRSNIMATHGMVASSQPLAVLAGLDMLRAGGTAADAAIAVAAALAVVEPFSTGIGGDCFALYWDNTQKRVFALNGSGPAAQNANIDDLLRLGIPKCLYSPDMLSAFPERWQAGLPYWNGLAGSRWRISWHLPSGTHWKDTR